MENSENSFSFPSIHNFPPFYTLQPTQTTWQNQAALCQGIRRKLKLDTLQAIIDTMVYRGTAEWDPPSKKDSAIIYWRKPEDWANLINNWVLETGMSNSIVTVYEIAHGDSAEGFEFHGLDQTILMKALDILVKKGVAQIFQGTSTDDMAGFVIILINLSTRLTCSSM
ncbi:ESCRT-II complex subunit VPS25 [Rhizophagus irregularis DAOM 181602=DAOM 197198]|nr:ESCRT-II complex subunit VPS25 [Rhizophagus irregularis DAOM 181602=DAOM 197198]